VPDFLEKSPVVFLMSLADFLDLVSAILGHWRPSLVVGVIPLGGFNDDSEAPKQNKNILI
jgi:hypothetical protein